MKFQNWIRKLTGRNAPVPRRRNERRRETFLAELNITRLETRRVLNGDGVTSELVIDAGAKADDGHADAFHLQFDQDQLNVSVNGEHFRSLSINAYDQLRINGSSDQDTLTVDLGTGLSAETSLRFDGGAGNDSVELLGGRSIESLIHAINTPDETRTQIQSQNGTVRLDSFGIEAIEDRLSADRLKIDLGDGADDVTLDRGDVPGVSRLTVHPSIAPDSLSSAGFTLSFAAPQGELRIIADGNVEDDGTRLDIKGFGTASDADFVFQGDSNDSLVFSGDVELGAGDLNVTAGNVHLFSVLRTDQASVEINASDDLVLSESGGIVNPFGTVELSASSVDVAGTIEATEGFVSIDGGDGGVATVSGTIDVATDRVGRTGGEVRVLGLHVGLFNQALIDASGDDGGGTVLIGGDYKGEGTIRTAFVTYVSTDAVIRVDAVKEGDGGKAIVWGDHTTRMHGTISARGGRVSGDGGLIETSGRVSLDISTASVDASASLGAAGTWLLDPLNVTIVNNAAQTNIDENAGVFSPNASGAQIGEDDINTALNLGTNVTITTDAGGAGTENGDVQLNANADILLNTAQNVTFRIEAAGDIDLRGTVTASAGTLNVELVANDNSGDQNDQDTAAGNVRIRDSVTTGGGTFSSSGVDFDNSGGVITTGGGDVTITHTGNIQVGAAINAGSGIASMETSAGDIDGGATVTASTLTLNAGGGIGTGTEFNSDVDTLNLITEGTGSDGDISLTEADAASLSIITDATAQTISVTTTSGDLTIGGAVGDSNDNVTLDASSGDIVGGATVTANALVATAGGGIGIGTALTADATTYSLTTQGVGADGNISLVDEGALNTSQLVTLSSLGSSQTISLTAATGDLTIDSAIGNAIDNLTLIATAGDIVGGLTALADSLTLQAGGGIGVGTAVSADATTYSLTTSGTADAGDITLVDTGSLNTSQITTLTTDATVQTISLTATTGAFTVDAAIGNSDDHLNLVSTVGNVVGGATATAATLTVDAGLGIGVGATLDTDSTTLDLISGGVGALGDITVVEADAVNLSVTTAGTAQTVDVTVTTGDLTAAGAIGDSNDAVSLTASIGDIVGGATVSAATLTLAAGGGIGIGTELTTDATSYSLTTAGTAAAGNISLVDVGALNTNQITTLATDASAQTVTLTATTGNLTVGAAIGDNTDDLTLIAIDGNINGGATANAATLTLDASDGIGVGAAFSANANSYSLTTGGADGAGNITVVDVGALNTNQITTLETAADSTQAVSLTASTGDLTVGNAIGSAGDDLTLIASAGNIAGTATVTAGNLVVNAAGGIGLGTALNTDADDLDLTSAGVDGAGNITVVEADAASFTVATNATAQVIDLTVTNGDLSTGGTIGDGADDVRLTTTGGNVEGGATVTANSLTVDASGGIGISVALDTDADTLDLTSQGIGAAGDITVEQADASSLSIATDGSAQSISVTLTTGDFTVGGAIGDGSDSLTFIASGGDIVGGGTVTANDLTLDASGGIGIGTAVTANATTYSLTSAGAGALGDISLRAASLNTDQITTLSTAGGSVQSISLTATTGDLTVGSAIGNGNDNLSLFSLTGDIVGGATVSAATLTLAAGGGIGIGTELTTDATSYSLTTAGTAAAGNISLVDVGALNTNQITTLATDASAQTVTLTATTGNLTVGAAIGDNTDDLTLIAIDGNINGGATANAATLTLDASDGIGVGAAFSANANSYSLTTGGADGAGNITVVDVGALNTNQITTLETAADSTQVVSLTASTGDLTVGTAIGNAGDDLTLIASAGNIAGTATVTAGNLVVNAAGGIGLGTALNTDADDLDLTSAGVDGAGNITVVEADAASFTVATNATAQVIDLTVTNGDFALSGGIGDGNDSLVIRAGGGNIEGGGTLTANDLTLVAAGGIGIGTAVSANATTYRLTTSGAGAAGNISLADTNALNTNQIVTLSTAGSAQTISLTAATGNLVVDTAIGNVTDNLTLTASLGDVVGGATVTAATLTVNAGGGIGIGTALGTDASNLDLTTSGAGVAGNINVVDADGANFSVATAGTAQTIDLTVTAGDLTVGGWIGDTTDDVNLTADGGNVIGGATVTADTLTVDTGGGIGIGVALATDANNLNLTTSGVGAAGDITVVQADAATFAIATDLSAQTISVTLTTGDLTAGGAIGDGNDSLTFVASSGNIVGGGVVTANDLTLSAGGGIGVGTAVTANAATYNLTTLGIGSAGDIRLIDTGALNTSQISNLSTDSSTQTIRLTASAGDLTAGAAIGNATDNLTLVSTFDNLVGGATVTAATLTLDAAGGIGVGTVFTSDASAYNLTSSGMNAAGDIRLVDVDALNTNEIVTLATDASAQTISLTALAGDLTVGSAIGNATDHLNLIALAGNVVGGATATADTLTVNASGGIGIGTPLDTDANTINLTTDGIGVLGNITVVQATASNLAVSTDTSAQTIDVTLTSGDFTVGGAIGDGADNLTFVATTGNIVGGGVVTANDLTLDAGLGIGVGTAVTADAATYNLTTSGTGAAGDITLFDVNGINTSGVTLTTAAGNQTVRLTASTGQINIDGDIGDAGDDLVLTANNGNIDGGATATAQDLILSAAGGIGIGAAVSANATTYELTTLGIGAAGNIRLADTNTLNTSQVTLSTDLSQQTIELSALTGNVSINSAIGNDTDNLTISASAGDVVGGATATANVLRLSAAGGIGVGTAVTADANSYDLTTFGVNAAGNITLSDTGTLNTSQVSLTTDASEQTVRLNALVGDLIVNSNIGNATDSLFLSTMAGNVVGGATASASTLTIDASGGIGIGTVLNTNAETLNLTSQGVAADGDIRIIEADSATYAISTDASSQSIDITQSAGDLTLGGAIGDGGDNLRFVASTGDIIGGGTVTAGVLELRAGGGIGIGTAVTADATTYSLTTSGTDAAGDISLIDTNTLNTSQITTLSTAASTQTIHLSALTGNLTVDTAIGNADDNLVLRAVSGNVAGGGNATAANLSVFAGGGIGIGGALRTSADSLDLTTDGSNSSGNITVVETDAVNLSITTAASSQSVSVTVSSGNLTINSALGDANDNLTLITSAGDVVGGGTVTADTLTVNASGGIGNGTPLQTDAQTLDLTSNGVGAAGNIQVVQADAATILVTTHTSAQMIAVTLSTGDFTVGGAIGDGNDSLTFVATDGDIVGGGTVTAGDLTLRAGGGIGIGTAVTADASSYDLTTTGDGALGNISLVSVNALSTAQVALSTDASTQTIALTADAGDLVVDGAIGDTSDNLHLTTNAGNILGGATATAATLSVDSAGGIGLGSALGTNADALVLSSNGIGNAGDISVVEADTADLTITTDASSQNVSITAASGDLTLSGPIGDSADNLTLVTSVGDVVGGATVTADTLTINAGGGIGIAVALDTAVNQLNLTSAGVGAAGDITLIEADSVNLVVVTDASSQLIDVTLSSGDFTVGGAIGDANDALRFAATTGNINGGGTVTAQSLTLSAGQGIGTGTPVVADAATYSLTTGGTGATGNISVVDTGNLATSQLINLSTHASTQNVTLTSATGSLTVDSPIGNSADDLTLVATAGNLSGGATATAGTLQLIAGGGIGIGTAMTTDAASYELSSAGIGAAGNISIIEVGALNTSQITSLVTDPSSQTVSLTASASDLTWDIAIGEAVDNFTLIATAGAVRDTGVAITADVLTVDAMTGVALNTNVTSLDAVNRGSGNLQIVESDAITIVSADQLSSGDLTISAGGSITINSNRRTNDAVSTVGGSIAIEASGSGSDLTVESSVASGTGQILLRSDGQLSLGSAARITTGNDDPVGIRLLANSDGVGGEVLAMKDSAILSTNRGRISGVLVNSPNPITGTQAGELLGGTQRNAEIEVSVNDPAGLGFVAVVDWLEGNPGDPDPLRRNPLEGDINNGGVPVRFRHSYDTAPNEGDITVNVALQSIAEGSIVLAQNGTDLLDRPEFATTVTLQVEGPLLPFSAPLPDAESVDFVRTVEQIAVTTPAAQRLVIVTPPLQFNNSVGSAVVTSQRYYVLRVVSFGENSEGEIKLWESEAGQKEFALPDLEDPDSDAGFELSQLPELFNRLPDDRYRIYLIEGQTERLVLDVIIRDGQPIEAQSDGEEVEPTKSRDEDQAPGEADGEEIPVEIPTEANAGEPKMSPAERLGSVPVVSAGSVLLAAGMARQPTPRVPGSTSPPRRYRNTLSARRPASWH